MFLIDYACPQAQFFASTNQQCFPDLGSNTLLVWNFCMQVSIREKLVAALQRVGYFLTLGEDRASLGDD